MSAKLLAIATMAIATLVVLRPAQTRAEQVEKVGGDVKAPRLISKVEPKYTDDATNRSVAGRVVLGVVISPDGRIHEVKVVESLDAGLDQNAVDAVKQWVFEPGTKKGKPVTVAARLEVNFKLK